MAMLLVMLVTASACGGDDGPAWERVVDIDGVPRSVVAAGGDLWVGVEADAREAVVRIDGDTGDEVSRTEVGSFDGPLVVVGDAVFAATYGYSRFGVDDDAVDLSTGGQLTIGDTPVIVGDRVFATTEVDGSRAVVELDPATLAQLAVVPIPAGPTDPEVIEVLWYGLTAVGDRLLVPVGFASGRGFVLFEPGAEELTWSTAQASEEPMASAVAIGDLVWVLDLRLGLHGLDVATGTPVATARLPAGDDAEGLIHEGQTSLAVGDDGTLWAVEQAAQMLVRLDPLTGAAIGTWHLDRVPGSIVLLDGTIWTNNPTDESLTGIDLAQLPDTSDE